MLGACLVTRIDFACIACVSHLGLSEEKYEKKTIIYTSFVCSRLGFLH